ncbi:MAG: site-specific integrase [Deltaproteobacteria bacterium]|nr:site-specific integrase [Deltaproteobacteria bacterium]
MGLYKRGQVWWMQLTYKGRLVRKSTEVSDKKLAEKIHAKAMTEIAEGKWLERPVGAEKTVKELLEKYMKEHSARNKALKSHIRDRSLSAHLNRCFGNLVLTDLSPRLISEYKAKRRDDGAAPNTVNNELRLLSHAFNLAVKEWEWVESNPVSKVSKERVNNQIERWLTHKEEESLLAVSPQWLREVIIFAVNTGLRQAEILDLTWDRVDLLRRTLAILEQKNRGKDTLPLNSHALEVLKARGGHPSERMGRRSMRSNHVFFNREGKRIDATNLLRAFYIAVEKAEIAKARFHDLRHTFATRLVQIRVDLYKVQKLMRHKSPIMTQRYAHHYPESLRDGVEALDRISTITAQTEEKGA